jgi:DNA-binding transcriptional regulator YdaS (Cro superfamily)
MKGMNLSEYFSEERGRQAKLAKDINAHASDLSRWADGTRPIPVEYGAAIEKATGGLVTRKEMFPNDWQRIWPELADNNCQSPKKYKPRGTDRRTKERREKDRREKE